MSDNKPNLADARKLMGSNVLTGTGSFFHPMVAEAWEDELIRHLFAEIRRLTPSEAEREDLRPNFSMEPDEEPDLSEEQRRMELLEEYPTGGCHRLDAEMRAPSVDLLVDAMDVVHKEGYDPKDGWEFWVYIDHLDAIRDDYEHIARMEVEDGIGEEAVAIHGVPVRGFDRFPPAAMLLWDPLEAVDTIDEIEKKTGGLARSPMSKPPRAGLYIVRPRYVCRVTSVGG